MLVPSGSEARSVPAELKHLSKRRKRKKYFIPLVAASEKGKAQTNHLILLSDWCSKTGKFDLRLTTDNLRLLSWVVSCLSLVKIGYKLFC